MLVPLHPGFLEITEKVVYEEALFYRESIEDDLEDLKVHKLDLLY